MKRKIFKRKTNIHNLEIEQHIEDTNKTAMAYVQKKGFEDGYNGIELPIGKNTAKRKIEATYIDLLTQVDSFMQEALIPNSQQFKHFIKIYLPEDISKQKEIVSQLVEIVLEKEIQRLEEKDIPYIHDLENKREQFKKTIEDAKLNIASQQNQSELMYKPTRERREQFKYLVGFFLFTIADFSINFQVIEHAGEMSKFASGLLCIAIALALGGASHFTGKGIKQQNNKLSIVSILLATVIFFILTIIRWTFQENIITVLFNLVFYGISSLSAYQYAFSLEEENDAKVYRKNNIAINNAFKERKKLYQKIDKIKNDCNTNIKKLIEGKTIETTKEIESKGSLNSEIYTVEYRDFLHQLIEKYTEGLKERINSAKTVVLKEYDVHHEEGVIAKQKETNI